ncbi:MAG: cell division protein FtsQ [Thermoanaerobacteraceae bacterium]|nr:cell division protein FtsQ [Thermoanaerobacteraceae bacterium]
MPGTYLQENIYTNSRKRKINKKRLLLLMAFLCIIAVMPVIYSPLFAVKNIQVLGNKNISSDEVIKVASFFYNKNLLMIKKGDVQKALYESIPVKEVQINYRLPHTLVICIKEREIAAALPYLGSFVLIDSDGIVVKIVPKLDYLAVPVVTGFNVTHASVAGPPVIENNADSFKKFLELISAVSPIASELSEIHVTVDESNDPAFYLYTLDGFKVFLGCYDDKKIPVMEQILEDLRKNNRGKGELNISGDTPVFKPFNREGEGKEGKP